MIGYSSNIFHNKEYHIIDNVSYYRERLNDHFNTRFLCVYDVAEKIDFSIEDIFNPLW